MSHGFVHFWASGTEAHTVLYEPLLRHGMELRLHCSGLALQRALRPPQRSEGPHLVIVVGNPEACFEAARLLRRVNASVGAVALLGRVGDRALAHALSVGIDACWPLEAPATQLVPAVIRLFGQTAAGSAKCSRSTSTPEWRLTSRTGVLQTPCGGRVTLTTAERALVNALLRAPGQQLNHARLTEAIWGSPRLERRGRLADTPGSNTDARRLSVLISRLRRKFDAAGDAMPIRSLRGQGYELCANLGHCPDAPTVGGAPATVTVIE